MTRIMKHQKAILIVFSFILVIVIGLSFYFNVPRLEYYYEQKTDSYTVTRVFGNEESYTIPATYQGKKVTKIGVRAFYQHTNLEEVIFENKENVVNISRLAFSECPKLKRIDVSQVAEIERNAFSYCTSLSSLEINAKNIGLSAFYGCTGLTSVTFKEKVKSIGSMAFGDTGLRTITIPSTVTAIYEECFCDCDDLEEIKVYGTTLKTDTYLLGLDSVIFIDEEDK